MFPTAFRKSGCDILFLIQIKLSIFNFDRIKNIIPLNKNEVYLYSKILDVSYPDSVIVFVEQFNCWLRFPVFKFDFYVKLSFQEIIWISNSVFTVSRWCSALMDIMMLVTKWSLVIIFSYWGLFSHIGDFLKYKESVNNIPQLSSPSLTATK